MNRLSSQAVLLSGTLAFVFASALSADEPASRGSSKAASATPSVELERPASRSAIEATVDEQMRIMAAKGGEDVQNTQIEVLKAALVEVLVGRALAEAKLETLKGGAGRTGGVDDVSGVLEAENRELAAELERVKQDVARLMAELDARQGEDATAANGAAGSGAGSGSPGSDGAISLTSEEPRGDAGDGFQVGEIHFNSGSASLTPGGRRKTLEAASRIRSMEIDRIRVVGYADTLGDGDQNKHLSLQRAQSIGDLLQSVGVPRDKIELVGSGEIGVPEPTADGISEPLNRCAGIYAVASYPK